VYKDIDASKIDDDLVDNVTACFGVRYIDLKELYRGAVLFSDRQKFWISFRRAPSGGCDGMSALGG